MKELATGGQTYQTCPDPHCLGCPAIGIADAECPVCRRLAAYTILAVRVTHLQNKQADYTGLLKGRHFILTTAIVLAAIMAAGLYFGAGRTFMIGVLFLELAVSYVANVVVGHFFLKKIRHEMSHMHHDLGLPLDRPIEPADLVHVVSSDSGVRFERVS